MITDKSPDFFLARSNKVLETCDWLGRVLNRIHRVDFSHSFWTRVLAAYATAAYNQKEFFAAEVYPFPVTFQPINGWSPAGRVEVLRDRVITTLRSYRGAHPLTDIPDKIPKSRRIAVGVRADLISKELDAVPLSFNWVPFLGDHNPGARARLLEEAELQKTTSSKNICRNVPQIYVEYFDALLGHLKRAEALGVEKVFVEHYGSSFELIFAAYLSERIGAELNQLQQGGFVGETVISIEPMKRAQYDRLLTYGWRAGPQDSPYFAIRLEQFEGDFRRHAAEKVFRDLLVVYGSPATSQAMQEHYEEFTEGLLAGIDRNKFPRILLRPRAKSRFLRMTDYPKAFKMARRSEIDSGHRPISSLCATSSLVIQVTTPSTNFLECIFVDKPVLALDTNQFPTQILRPHLEFFRRAGILHESTAAMVGFLNSVDVSLWWGQLIREEEYKEFKRLFTRSRVQYLEQLDGRENDI
ncbi:hypothetical protein H5368_04240 [Luteimonas sp. MC1782]|uniref:hypothetical protein n=1 Tax=Luteimonas sp. MC1782 TaxID=2760305 RepID=UPI0015FFA9DA|nr:hypothetical protein [Luteimonas sp. MC1782]MBB1472234.1 hypothetical protein [Luteimonas sp. MC1782]